jgi:deoxyribodipyrimidine photolyase-related protein
MASAALIYPHQLFHPHPAIAGTSLAVLVEEPLFFGQYSFHRQKLILHRASMKRYAERLKAQRRRVVYVDARELADTADLARILLKLKVSRVRYVDPCDDWLATRLASALAEAGIAAEVLDDPDFLTPADEIANFVAGKKRLFFTDFYIRQRSRLNILLTPTGKPVGGQWSFDPENRKKLPKKFIAPTVPGAEEDEEIDAARAYVRDRFPNALGQDQEFRYPTDHDAAADWLEQFVAERLESFGDYEDAISREHDVLFHSALTPMLNTGLLSPRQVIDAALKREIEVPLNSLEGFVRQVIGWREFVRLVYKTQGRRQRSRDFWGFSRELPAAFYDGNTGVDPVDHVIKKVLRTGYCHHIERLMILGNFMLLCGFNPDAVYRWFMELFIDAYDWVMVPNVYGMSQHADGGLMTTKPYISGSAYVRKMSDFKPGSWCEIWDALYWRFIDEHADFLGNNARMRMIVKLRDKLGPAIAGHRRTAERFLKSLG